MQQTDRERRIDDGTTHPGNGDPRSERPSVVRLLANPRRVRRT